VNCKQHHRHRLEGEPGMDKENELFLAALLSDVGLVKEYSDEDIPHWEASLQFLRKGPNLEALELDTKLLFSLIERHHETPNSRMEKILPQADALVLGTYKEEPKSEKWKSASPPAFVSIFSKLYPASQTPEFCFLSPTKLDPQSLLVPTKDMRQDTLATSYASLWEGLMSEVADLPAGSLSALTTSLVALLMKYLVRVPATKTIGATSLLSQDDVSLFERCRLKAALAHCMASLSEEKLDDLDKQAECPVEKRPVIAQLISGDLSGIQAFIYTITSEGVAKGVRGRSLYLQLLGEAIARRVLTSLKLPDVNLLYNSGGNFYILAPAKPDADIQDIQKEINAIMLRHHHGDVYCALAGVGLTRADFLKGNKLAERWASLTQALSSKKRRKFADMAVDEYDKLFVCANMPVEDLCVICTQEKTIDGETIGSFCRSFEKLGNELGRSDYLIQADATSTEVESQEGGKYTTYRSVLRDLGSIYKLTDERKVGRQVRFLARFGPTNIRVHWLNNTCFLSDLKLQSTVGRGFRLLGNVNPWKMESTDPKPLIADFSSLADSSCGVKRWAVLRMDIDNLGTLFKEGFNHPEERCKDDTRPHKHTPISNTSLARVTSLSFQLSLFFEGYLNEIVKKYNKFDPNNPSDKVKSDHLYIIYSGGDDLFIVGSWNVIIEVASDIRTQFCQYVCENPKATLSGGISLHRKKYPLYKAADIAKDALEDAKDHVYKTKKAKQEQQMKKNALGMFGKAFHWDKEFVKVAALKKDILALVKDGKDGKTLSKGFLHRLADIYKLYVEGGQGKLLANINDAKSTEQIQSQLKQHRWRWRSAYAFAREERTFEPELKALRHKLEEKKWIQYLNVAVRWVELLLRQE